MARFKFRLQILLKLALKKEEDVKKELANWQKLLLETRSKLQSTSLDIIRKLEEKSQKKKIEEIILYETYLESLNTNKKRFQEEIQYFEKEIDKTIIKLQEAMKERKILEKLKEKKLEQYKDEQNLIEQKETDEIGTKIFIDGR